MAVCGGFLGRKEGSSIQQSGSGELARWGRCGCPGLPLRVSFDQTSARDQAESLAACPGERPGPLNFMELPDPTASSGSKSPGILRPGAEVTQRAQETADKK